MVHCILYIFINDIYRNWQQMVHKTRQEKQIHNTICVGHHYTQTNTNNVNMTQPFYKQLEVKLRFYPSRIGDISWFWQSCLGLFGFTADKDV